MHRPEVCSTRLGAGVPASARTACVCRSRLRVARLRAFPRIHVVSKADRRNSEPPPSIIDFIAEEAAEPLPSSAADSSFEQEEIRPSYLDKPEQQQYIDDFVATYVEQEKGKRQKDRRIRHLLRYEQAERAKQGIYDDPDDIEEHVDDFIEFPTDLREDEDVQAPEPYIEHDWEPNELRAWVEKRRYYAQKGVEWDQMRAGINRGSVGNTSEFTDVRLMPKDGPAKRWTHQEIWNLITEDGYNYNPSGHKAIVFRPDIKCDYFSEPIVYVEDVLEMLEAEGRIWEDAEEPDMTDELTIAMNSDYADSDEDADSDQDEQDDSNNLDGDEEVPTGADQVESLESAEEAEQEDFDDDENDDDDDGGGADDDYE